MLEHRWGRRAIVDAEGRHLMTLRLGSSGAAFTEKGELLLIGKQSHDNKTFDISTRTLRESSEEFRYFIPRPPEVDRVEFDGVVIELHGDMYRASRYGEALWDVKYMPEIVGGRLYTVSFRTVCRIDPATGKVLAQYGEADATTIPVAAGHDLPTF